VFETLSERLTQVFSSLRGKGRLSQADIDATAREIRIALLEADVALPVVRAFIARVKERAGGEEVSGALNRATGWATRSRWPASPSKRRSAASRTWSSSTPPAGWASTRR
jgi:signal recognition particle GTPase